jgi:hypothetical protein
MFSAAVSTTAQRNRDAMAPLSSDKRQLVNTTPLMMIWREVQLYAMAFSVQVSFARERKAHLGELRSMVCLSRSESEKTPGVDQQQPQLSPRQASLPSLSSKGTARSAASESNHAISRSAFTASPTKVMPAK